VRVGGALVAGDGASADRDPREIGKRASGDAIGGGAGASASSTRRSTVCASTPIASASAMPIASSATRVTRGDHVLAGAGHAGRCLGGAGWQRVSTSWR
jgi:hypothetical protein